MNRFSLTITFVSIILLLQSCFWEIEREIEIDTGPFNNFNTDGNTQLITSSEYIILIPDIQYYTYYQQYNIILERIIDRIIEMNKLGYKVKAVAQVGDITENNSVDSWLIAKAIFSKLDSVKINYILTTGNHDYGSIGNTDSRQTYFNDYFNFSNQSPFLKCYHDSCYENSLFEISIQGKPLQIISLEFGPRDSIIKWADEVLDKNKMSLLVTHAYLFKDKERYNWSELADKQTFSPYYYSNTYNKFATEKVNDGEDIWRKLVYSSFNIRLVLCGHQTLPDYVGNLISKNMQGNDVLQMLFNTQNFPNGGDGWIQILEFKNDKRTVNIKTYSCIYNKWDTNSRHQYSFFYD